MNQNIATFRRRVVGAVVVPGLAFGLIALGGGPVQAGTTSAPAQVQGVCNGVVNQLAHRGNVQGNLLKAAARQNAEIIAGLTGERSELQATRATLESEIRRPPWRSAGSTRRRSSSTPTSPPR